MLNIVCDACGRTDSAMLEQGGPRGWLSVILQGVAEVLTFHICPNCAPEKVRAVKFAARGKQ